MPRRLSYFWQVAVILVCLVLGTPRVRVAENDPAAQDEKLLKDNKVATDGAGLLDYFKKRTLGLDDEKRIRKLIGELGNDDFEVREKATENLTAAGDSALRFLREALKDPDIETRHRAEQCISSIEGQTRGGVLPAAVRVLARRHPEGTIPALLAYLPHAAGVEVREQVLDALLTIGTSDGKPDALLVESLKSEQSIRRLAAVHVLGRLSDAEIKAAVLQILKTDKDPMVRLRAAQGMVAGKHREAIPELIQLLAANSAEAAAGAEVLLWQLAGEKSPSRPTGKDSDELRMKYRDLWLDWWKQQGDKVDLATVLNKPPYLNYTLVPEAHRGRVFEWDRDGKVRWEIGDLKYPIDAQVLPNGHVLIAELNGNRVAEHTTDGKVVWEKAVTGPIACERLPNGHTFVGTNQSVYVFDKDGKEVLSHTPGGGFFIHSTQHLRNGHIIMLSTGGNIAEIDGDGKTVVSFNLQGGGWSGIESVGDKRYLVANLNTVQEVDAEGKVHWEYKGAGASYASRLPSGNTLVALHSGNRIVEVDRDGKIVWEKHVESNPWRVHRR